MWAAIVSFLPAAIGSFLLGVIGWFVTSFIGKPFLDFLNLRGRVHEEIVFTGNIGPMVAHNPDYERAVESLRRLGAEVQATNIKAIRPLRWLFSGCGYDLVKAGRGLIGLSNCLSSVDDGRAFHVSSIQRGLKLPRDFTDDDLRHVADRIQRPLL